MADPLDHDGNGKKGGAVKMVPVYLDFDTWLGSERIKAAPHTVQQLPLDRAKALVAEGKARRADPMRED